MWSIVLLNEQCVCGGTYSRSTVFGLVRFAKPNLCVWGESSVDEPLVSTVILPQIGELPVYLSIALG